MMEKCPGHKLPILLYKSPVKVWAGGKTPNTPIPIGATILDLAGGLKSPIMGLDALESRVVRIEWPDMSTPAIDPEGWRKIVKALVNLRKPLFIACGAGHGRTGTALTIFGCLTGQIPRKMDPVAWVRDRYCPNAVETRAQILYIEQVTLRSVAAKPSGGSVGTYAGWQAPEWDKDKDKKKKRESDAGPAARESYPRERPASETFRHFGGTRSAQPLDDDPELDPHSPLNRI